MASRINAAKAFPCPSCGVYGGEECWPRAQDDSNWVHSQRMALVQANTAGWQPHPGFIISRP